MDNLTHSLVGLAIARSGFRTRVPAADGWAIAAANAPDLDLLTGSRGLPYLEYHRGLTHSILALPAWTALFVGLGWWMARRRARPFSVCWAAWLAGLAAGSHLVLDYLTSYGTRLLAPWSRHWFAADWAPIVDPWLWLGLGLLLGLPYLVRRRGQRWSGALALLFLTAWLGLRGWEHAAALNLAKGSRTTQQMRTVPESAALPTFLSPFAWHGLLATPGRYEHLSIDTRTGSAHRPSAADASSCAGRLVAFFAAPAPRAIGWISRLAIFHQELAVQHTAARLRAAAVAREAATSPPETAAAASGF